MLWLSVARRLVIHVSINIYMTPMRCCFGGVFKRGWFFFLFNILSHAQYKWLLTEQC